MVWYIPPLSPVVEALTSTGHDGEDLDNLFGAIDTLRIPLAYLAELFTAGDTEPVRRVLRRLSAMRSYMRAAEITALYRLLAIAKYHDRYVIPTAYEAEGRRLEETACSLDFEGGPGMYGSGPFGEASGQPIPVSVETFHALKERQTGGGLTDPERPGARINLLNWDGKGRPDGLFPPERPQRQEEP